MKFNISEILKFNLKQALHDCFCCKHLENHGLMGQGYLFPKEESEVFQIFKAW